MKKPNHMSPRIPSLIGFALLVCLTALSQMVDAGTLSASQVRSAVLTWVHSVTADARPEAVIEQLDPYERDGEIVAYIAHLSGGGYCLCGANETVLPVYLYCPHGSYDQNNPACQSILSEIAARTKCVSEGLQRADAKVLAHQEELSERAALWNQLAAGSIPAKGTRMGRALAEPDSMSLPLTSRWNQSSPYNDQCPELTPGSEQVPVGCVATAISQIMYYWQWPATGIGSHTDENNYNYRWRSGWDGEPLSVDPSITGWANRLQWTSASGGRLQMNGYWDASLYAAAQKISTSTSYLQALANLYNRLTSGSTTNSANFGATTYQWSLMQDVHTDPVDAGDVAVATLGYQVAVALDMDFGIKGSGTPLYYAIDVRNNRVPLVNNFRYDADVESGYGHTDISSLITSDIQWMRPVAYAGTSSTDSHVWVLCGYNKGTDPNRQFKMNMGWGGTDNGWYSLDNVPSDLTQYPGYLIYIAPEGVVRFVGGTTSGDGSPLQPYTDISAAVASASSGATLIFKAGSDNTFTAPLTINKALTLRGRDVTIRAK